MLACWSVRRSSLVVGRAAAPRMAVCDSADRSSTAFLWRRLSAESRAVTGRRGPWRCGRWDFGAPRAAVLGSDVTVMRQRVEAAVRQAFDREAAAARGHAAPPRRLASIDAALEGEARAVRDLFDALSAGVGERRRHRGHFGLRRRRHADCVGGTPVRHPGRPRPRAPAKTGSCWSRCSGCGSSTSAPWTGARRAWWSPNAASAPLRPRRRWQACAAAAPTRYRLNTRWADRALEAASGDARTSPDPSRVRDRGPHGRPLLTAIVEDSDLVARARPVGRRGPVGDAGRIVAVAALFAAGAVLDWRAMTRAARPGARGGRRWSAASCWRGPSCMVEPAAGWSSLAALHGRHLRLAGRARGCCRPRFDFLLTAIALTAMVLVALQWIETARRRRRGRRPVARRDWLTASAGALLAGMAAAFVLQGHAWVLRDTVAHSTLDPLHFSLAPFSAARLALQLGLIAAHAAAVAALVTLFRASTSPWLVARRSAAQAALVAAWVLPTALWSAARAGEVPAGTPLPGVALALTLAVLLTLSAPAVWARYRNGSQGFRLVALALAPVVPALAFYPTVFAVAWRAKSDLVETRYAPQALNQRRHRVCAARGEPPRDRRAAGPRRAGLGGARRRINRAPPAIARSRCGRPRRWRAIRSRPRSRSTDADGAPAQPLRVQPAGGSERRRRGPTKRRAAGPWPRRWRRSSPTSAASTTPAAPCAARTASPWARSSCTRCSTTRTCRSPPRARRTWSCCSRSDAARGPGRPGRRRAIRRVRVEPHAASTRRTRPPGRSTTLSSRCVEQSRDPVWARLQRNGEPFDVFLMNDRGGIYALGFPAVVRARTPGEPRRADDAGRGGLPRRRGHRRRVRPGGAPVRAGASAPARGAGQLLPQAVPGLRRRGGGPGGAAGVGGAQLRRQRDAQRRGARGAADERRRQPRGVGPDRAAGRAAGIGARRQPDGVGAPPDRRGRQHLRRHRAAGHQRAHRLRLGPAVVAHARPTSTARWRCGARPAPWRASGSATSSTWSPPRPSGSAASTR